MSGAAPEAVVGGRAGGAGVGARRRALLRWGVAGAVSTGFLAYLFASRQVDPRALAPLVAGMAPGGLVAFVLISLVALGLRALRYWVLLGRRAPFGPLVLVTLVRNLAVDLVPARLGALASYLYLLTARLGVPVEAAIVSFSLAFVLDTLALAPLLLGAVAVVGGAPVSPGVLAAGCAVLLLGSVVALAVLAPALRLAARGAARFPGWLRRAAGPLERAAREVGVAERSRVLVPALLLSFPLRVAKYAAYYALLQGLLAQQGGPGWLDPLRVFLSVAGAELAASLPLPTVASLGPYEVAGALGFEWWLGLPRSLAALAATAFHGLSQLHDYTLGLLAFLALMSPWVRPQPPGARPRAGADRAGRDAAGTRAPL